MSIEIERSIAIQNYMVKVNGLRVSNHSTMAEAKAEVRTLYLALAKMGR